MAIYPGKGGVPDSNGNYFNGTEMRRVVDGQDVGPAVIRLIAKHCRACDNLLLGRFDAPATQSGQHSTPDGMEECPSRDFGPDILLAEVPW